MRTTIDRAGRLVVPREIRRRMRLEGGETLELTEHDGVIEITVAPASVDIVASKGGLVARSRENLPPLTDADVRRTLDIIRR